MDRNGWYCHIIRVLLAVQIFAAAAFAEQSAPPPSPPAAIVNGTVISVDEFQRELERIQRLKGAAKTADEGNLADMKREALENLIIREVLFKESVARKVVIDTATLDREMAQVKSRFASPEQFLENLRRVKMDESTMREQVARGLTIRALMDRAAGDGGVEEEEIRRYYDSHKKEFTRQPQVRLRHILAAVASGSPASRKSEAARKLSELRRRAMDGEDFSGLATTHSDCQSRKKGGDIGWFAPGELSPEIEKAVAPLKVGQVSEAVEDRFGLHIIKLEERTEAFTSPLDDVRDQIRSLVRQEKGLIRMQRYVKSLRNAASVEIVLRDSAN